MNLNQSPRASSNTVRAGIVGALSLLLAASTAACIPHPGGQCAADSDCGYGLSCQAGLCEKAPPRICAPACAAGLHCNDGQCALDAAPIVSWGSPVDGLAVANGTVALALSIAIAAPLPASLQASVEASVSVVPLNSAGASPTQIPLALAADGLYRGLVDASLLAERDWMLTPVIEVASASYGGPSIRLRVDRTGPRIDLLLPSPSASSSSASSSSSGTSASFLRTDTIEVRARIVDDGAGIGDDATDIGSNGPAAPIAVAVAAGMTDIPGTRIGAQEWSFQVPLSLPTFASGAGPLALGVRARDRLGNLSVAMGSVPVTRALWQKQIGGGLPIRSSPALDADHLFIGTDSGNLVALDRTSSAVLWSRSFNGPLSGSPALGSPSLHTLYAASEGGELHALNPDTGAVLWSCADLPAGLSFLASPAVLSIPASPSSGAREAVVIGNTGSFISNGLSIAGGVLLLDGSTGFTRADGTGSSFLLAPVGGGRSSAAIDPDGTITIGGDDARAHALAFQSDAGAESLSELWSAQASDDISASPALRSPGALGAPGAQGAPASVFGDESGQLLWLGSGGAPQESGKSVDDKIFASPVFAFGTLLVLDRSGTLSPFSDAARPSRSQAGIALPASYIYAPATIAGASNVQSTPAVGADGTVYLAAGRSLYAFAPSGQLLWSLPLPGAATASSPTIGCNGTLFIGDASGNLSAFATDSAGLAPGWSRFRQDARNSGNAAMAAWGACE